jgi:hypothetical protein
VIPTVRVVNQSTVVSEAEFQTVVAACAKQVVRDFSTPWAVIADVIAGGIPSATDWIITILDNSDQDGALGYHDNSQVPAGRVFAHTDQLYGLKWSVTLSHEILELLADPFLLNTAQIRKATFVALEVCDPCEADEAGYEIDGVSVSDFVLPAWFGSPGPRMDFAGHITRSFDLMPGGYVSLWTPLKGWTQKMARTRPGQASRAEQGHRFAERAARPRPAIDGQLSKLVTVHH